MFILFRRLQNTAPKLVLLCGIALGLSLGVVACGGSSSSSNGSDQTLAITDIPDQELVIGTSLTLNVAVTGGTGTTSYSVSSTPASEATLTIDQATGELTIDATSASAATVEVTVTVEEGGETAEKTFQLSIVPELTISVGDQELAARATRDIRVITTGGLISDTVTGYEVTGSNLVRIDPNSGLLTIDASGVGTAAAAVTVMVSAMSSRGTTVTGSFMLTITPPVLTIRVTDASANQVSVCSMVEGETASQHAIDITGPPVGTDFRWRIEDSGGIMDDDVTNGIGGSYGNVGEVNSAFDFILSDGVGRVTITLRTIDDGKLTPGGDTLTISILPSLDNGYQLPTTAGTGYTIGTVADVDSGGGAVTVQAVQVVCSSVDAPTS